MNRAVVERLGRMVGDLAIVGIRAAIEQELGQLRMMSDSRRTVERALPFRFGLVLLFKEAGIGVGARLEQSRGRLENSLGASRLEPQKLGKAEVRQRVPMARTSFDRSVCRVVGEEARDRLEIAEERRRLDIAVRNL